jgi:hypothetical protein
MSTTAVAFDFKEYLAGTIERIGDAYLSDLKFIPEDKIAASPMGVARSPLEFTNECAGFNTHVANVISGREGSGRKFSEIDNIEESRAALKTSCDELVAVVRAASMDDLTTIEKPLPWGENASLFRMANMCVAHMMYHDGQINYIQALYGDGANHWAGE